MLMRFQIDLCRTLGEARSRCVSDYALAILDINLPDGSGLDYLRDLRFFCKPLFFSFFY